MEKTNEEIVCPKCILGGVKSSLFPPEKTEEGWVQHCERGHKLYLLHYVRIEDGLIIDLLNKKAYSLSRTSKN